LAEILLSFWGDDFTGSTDAMESLTRAGLRTVLFTEPPTAQQLARFPDLRAFGVAGMTRAMPPDEMETTLRPALAALRDIGPGIVHYKVCSTFDSSPTVGSIGRVIDIGLEVFGGEFVPVVVGAPALGRYCVFGNLFARAGAESEPFRLDRHPSMSRHPVTPTDEADLRLHLGKQTKQPIGLLDVLAIESGEPQRELDRIVAEGARVVLIDLLLERQLATVGRLLTRCPFVVGSSGVNMALGRYWSETGTATPQAAGRAGDVGPVVAICGSCSPVTDRQIRWATEHGFDDAADVASAVRSLRGGRSVVIHSRRMKAGEPIGPTLGRMLREVIEQAKVRRAIVAGGDTSGAVARELGIESMEMIAELTRGSPLCRVTAPGSIADGIEITFKGGQIGKVDFFGQVRAGVSDAG
jgi:uncharacterized protein YgbK (DUF1537 family)